MKYALSKNSSVPCRKKAWPLPMCNHNSPRMENSDVRFEGIVFPLLVLWKKPSATYTLSLIHIFLEELPAGVVKRMLKNCDENKRQLINQFLRYPENSAGSIMTIESVSYKHLDVYKRQTEVHERTGNFENRSKEGDAFAEKPLNC